MNGITKQMVWCGSHLCDRAVLEDKDIARLYKHWRALAGMHLMFDRSEMPGPRFHSADLKVAQDWLDAAVLLWFEGRPANLPPITEGVPDIPERPTVTVERFEAEPNAASKTMVLAILLGALVAGALIGYGFWAGVVSLRGF